MGDLPHRVQPDPDGRYTVDVHVTPEGNARIGGRDYTPEEFADVLRRNGDYDGRPIRLIGCDAGSNDFAQRLSRELDTPVLAPNRPAWTDANGRVFSSDYEIGPDGRVQPRIPPNGEWSVHNPDGTTTRAGDDGFTPDTPDSAKHDVDADSARARGEDPADGSSPDADDEFTIDENPFANADEIPHGDPRFDDRFVNYNRGPDSDFTTHPDSPIDVPPRPRVTDPAPGVVPDAADVRRTPEVLDGYVRPDGTLPPNQMFHVRNMSPDGTYVTSETRFYTDGDGRVRWVELSPGTGPAPGGGKNPPNPDFDFPLLPDTQYRVDNYKNSDLKWDFHTDERGLPDGMTGTPDYSDVDTPKGPKASDPRYRDDGDELKFKDGKWNRDWQEDRSYTAQGRSAAEGRAARPDLKFDGGHFAPAEAGGPPGYGNMHPQMSGSNQGKSTGGWSYEESWRSQEAELADYHSPPDRVVEQLQASAPRVGDNGLPIEEVMRWRVTEMGPDGPVTRVFERRFPIINAANQVTP